MYPTIFLVFKIASIVALLVALRCGFIVATESDSLRRGNARFIATFLIGAWICTLALLMFFYDQSLPVFEFSGRIDSVNVLNSTSRRYSAYLSIQTTSGGSIQVHVSDRSRLFVPGRQVSVRYRGDTGELIKAVFYSNDGKKVGVAQSTVPWRQLLTVPFGLYFVWIAFRRYCRDPEGAES